MAYLENLSRNLGRKLTDGEVFGFSQVNSEHCRHKIFNGTFVIDGTEHESSLFRLIKLTTDLPIQTTLFRHTRTTAHSLTDRRLSSLRPSGRTYLTSLP
ncbi:MAG: hypothetical protein MZV63_45480 [Marinilabiliales bacterium]|nr:hypothetical protein [Marinilabiliales bacterium]